MKYDLRNEKLIAQHIDVALVYKEMLGLDEARAYLKRENIPREIAERVLLTEQKRGAGSDKVSSPPAATLFLGCRRKNHIHHAIVEAALKLEKRRGTEWALHLLRSEKVPESVVARITAPEPRQMRTKAMNGHGTLAAGTVER